MASLQRLPINQLECRRCLLTRDNRRHPSQSITYFITPATILDVYAKTIGELLGELSPIVLHGRPNLYLDRTFVNPHNDVHRPIAVARRSPPINDSAFAKQRHDSSNDLVL